MRMNTELRAALAVSALVAFLAAALSFLAPYTEGQLSSSITLTDRAFAVLRQVEVRNDHGSYTLTLEDGVFRADFVESEKKNLITTLQSQKNDKRSYSQLQLLSKMCARDS